MKTAEAKNKIKRWERKYPRSIVRLFVEDALVSGRSTKNRTEYSRWLEANTVTLREGLQEVSHFFGLPCPDPDQFDESEYRASGGVPWWSEESPIIEVSLENADGTPILDCLNTTKAAMNLLGRAWGGYDEDRS